MMVPVTNCFYIEQCYQRHSDFMSRKPTIQLIFSLKTRKNQFIIIKVAYVID